MRGDDRGCVGLIGRAAVGDAGGVVKGRCDVLAAARLFAVAARCPVCGDGDGGDSSGERVPPRVLLVGVSDGPCESMEVRSFEGPALASWMDTGGGRGFVDFCSKAPGGLPVCLTSFLAARGTGALISLMLIVVWAFGFLARGGDTSAATLEDDAVGSANG